VQTAQPHLQRVQRIVLAHLQGRRAPWLGTAAIERRTYLESRPISGSRSIAGSADDGMRIGP
jgi:hypothetical protein